jgi:hypothetical protein
VTLLTIRASKRYATRQSASVACLDGANIKALLIELSTEGCRVSTTETLAVRRGDEVAVKICGKAMRGSVRWADSRTIGLRFDKALFQQELRDILAGGAAADPAKPQSASSACRDRLAANG